MIEQGKGRDVVRRIGPPVAATTDSAAVPPRTLLIGVARSIGQLLHVLELAQPRPRIIGCLLPASAVETVQPAVPVLGNWTALADVLQQGGIDQVLVSLPAAMQSQLRHLALQLDRAAVIWRFLPTLDDQLAGRTAWSTGGSRRRGEAAGVTAIDIDPAQLIDRRPRPLDEPAIAATLRGKVVLITGAGGSIGSELARMVCRFEPARLVLVERAENALFEIDRHLARLFPQVARAAVMHDVTNAPRTMALLGEHRPAVIFHAAAHKHVPMMEDHPAEAVENNFYGTRSIADAADTHGVERFVMISSDKAVNPSSVMGATKRLAELYIRYLNERSTTTFSMVRFGNVLGSACSVLPIWGRQIAEGSPVTITHPDMSRYFMTIPEAAGLVLQSAALSGGADLGSHGGEVFLLDMGEPIRILNLARRFIQAHGLEPDIDVPIEFTGIRPGEKLFEVLAYDSEDMLPTAHASIRVWRTQPTDAAQMMRIIQAFDRLRAKSDAAVPADAQHFWQHASRDAILHALRASIPEMVTAAAG